jgi:hypothetical protein
MNTKKTPTDQKNKNVLYQLESLITTLYPKYKTVNPYQEYLQSYYEDLNIEDVLLFKRLLKSITLLNHKERTQQNRTYISSYGDVLTTIELIGRYTINDKLLKSYTDLKYIFRESPFTKLQAARVLRKSMRYVERLLPIFYHLKLAEKTNIKQGQKHTYRLLGYENTSTHQEIFEEFEDHRGFTDVQMRT